VHYFFSVAKSGTKQKLNKKKIKSLWKNKIFIKVEDLSGNVFDFLA
jgi:hypothetical protein